MRKMQLELVNSLMSFPGPSPPNVGSLSRLQTGAVVHLKAGEEGDGVSVFVCACVCVGWRVGT